MDFKSLVAKLHQIDENTEVAECGDMPGDIMHPPVPQQADSVTMNVSMNGSGSGGIKDLMNILRSIENAQEPHPHAQDKDALFGDSFENSLDSASGEETLPVSAALPTGDDLASKGKEAPKVNGGGNPMQAELVAKLAELYQSIKESAEK